MRSTFFTAVFVLSTASTALADVLYEDDVIVDGALCVGYDCILNEFFSSDILVLKSASPEVRFNDTSSDNDDWYFDVNSSGGVDFFSIRNTTDNTIPFTISGGASSSSIYIGPFGDIGLGTALPQRSLHISRSLPAIRMEDTVGAGGTSWDILADFTGFAIRDNPGAMQPFAITKGAPSSSLWITSDGWVGLGTPSAGAPLHLRSADGFNFFRITAEGAAVNDSVDITFTGGPLGTGQLRYNIVDGDNQEMSLDADGNMVLDGTLTTAGPTCAAGCDRVFDKDYPLPSISEHAQQMFASGHLPALGPTQPHAPINVTEKLAGVINELEHAHIYIAQQQDRMDRQDAYIARLERKLDDLISSQ